MTESSASTAKAGGKARLPKAVYLLSLCNGYLFINQSLLITISGLIGLQLATDKSLATLPMALQFAAVMCTTVPASLFMGRFGRQAGFLLGNSLGIVGACIALYALFTSSFESFCVATFCFGMFAAFSHYYRFTAAELVEGELKSVAISWVMAGGVLAALIGPNLASWSSTLFTTERFAGPFAVLILVYLLSMLTVLSARLPRPSKVTINDARRSIKVIASQPIFIVAVICQMLGYGTMNLVMSATPLAMAARDYQLDNTALVIQWHVFAMFAPSFVTGHLIKALGLVPVLVSGVVCGLACVAINLNGESQWHFLVALILLGISWNFLFVGGTSLLVEAHTTAEKSRTQAINDLIVFSTVTITALSAGRLHHHYGWQTVNLTVIPLYLVTAVAIAWLIYLRRAKPAAKVI